MQLVFEAREKKKENHAGFCLEAGGGGVVFRDEQGDFVSGIQSHVSAD